MPNVALRTFIAVAIFALSMPAVAALQRTFVASTGSDSNPCSLPLPCRGFATAIAAVAPAGEVIVLDSGGYGPVVITQSVSIIAPAGVYAGVSVASGDGIAVSAGPSDRVVLRGPSVNGQGGGFGIRVSSGKEIDIEDCHIGNLTFAGILIEGGTATHIARTKVRGGGAFGIWASPSSPIAITLTITDTEVSDNGNVGIYIGPVVPGSVVNASTTRVTASHNLGGGLGVNTNNAGTGALAVSDSGGNHNGGPGIFVNGTNAIAMISGSSFVGNGSFDLSQGPGSVLRTGGNNAVTGRGAPDISGALTSNPLK